MLRTAVGVLGVPWDVGFRDLERGLWEQVILFLKRLIGKVGTIDWESRKLAIQTDLETRGHFLYQGCGQARHSSGVGFFSLFVIKDWCLLFLRRLILRFARSSTLSSIPKKKKKKFDVGMDGVRT